MKITFNVVRYIVVYSICVCLRREAQKQRWHVWLAVSFMHKPSCESQGAIAGLLALCGQPNAKLIMK